MKPSAARGVKPTGPASFSGFPHSTHHPTEVHRMTRLVAILAVWFALTLVHTASAEDLPISRGLGKPVPNFTLTDVVSGMKTSLYDFRGKKAGVIVFTGTQCPVGNLYMPRLAELEKAYRDKGVVFLLVNSNARESAEDIARHAKEYGVGFPVLKDPKNVVADTLLAQQTCETLVVDGKAVLRYRGAIDDQYTYGKGRPKATKNYLKDAIDAIVEGREVETTATTVAGCTIERVEPAGKPAIRRVRPAPATIVEALEARDGETRIDVGRPTYAGEVAEIVRDRCRNCHRPGQVGPFALMTYDDVVKHKATIRSVVDERRMPPWHADPRYGHFENDRSLTPKQRAALLAWIDADCPPGDLSKQPADKTWPGEWSVGTPDIVFKIPEDYIVAAQGTLPYQHLKVPTNFTEDVWVSSIEARPGDRAVVHHIIVYLLGPDGRRTEHLGGYAPGDMPSVYPPGIAKRIPAGAGLEFEIHYTPVGKVHVDRSSVGFTVAKSPVKREAHTIGIAEGRFEIPPNAPDHPVTKTWNVKEDMTLLAFMPHMHLRGKSFRYTLIDESGKEEILLDVPAYDFGWQSYYRLAEPRRLKKGMKLRCDARYDNSSANPANPAPNETVRWGDQTWQEMMIGYIDVIPDRDIDHHAATSPKPAPDAGAQLRRARRILGRAVTR